MALAGSVDVTLTDSARSTDVALIGSIDVALAGSAVSTLTVSTRSIDVALASSADSTGSAADFVVVVLTDSIGSGVESPKFWKFSIIVISLISTGSDMVSVEPEESIVDSSSSIGSTSDNSSPYAIPQ